MVRRKKVLFTATRIVKIPTKVTFVTNDGERVSFRATKAVRRRKRVSFYSEG